MTEKFPAEEPSDNPIITPAYPVPFKPSRRGEPVMENVKQGDRWVRYNSGPNQQPGGERVHWDIVDRKTNRVIARACEKQVADEIASGLRDLYGTPINGWVPPNN